jgi:hypothetical protein
VIIYDLACAQDHRFEGWFVSATEFEHQAQEKQVQCPLCGSSDIRRVVSAAYVHTSSASAPEAAPDEVRGEAYYGPHAGVKPTSAAFAKIVRYIVENTEDVGRDFPEEARRIHYREASERQIRGTASQDEVAELRDEGIEVMSLPFPLPQRGKVH